MTWQEPIADPKLEQVWRRMWVRHILLFAGYLLIFLVLYFRMRYRIAEEKQFYWEQGLLTRKFLLVMGIHLAGIVIWYCSAWLYHWKRFFLAPLSPHNLALMRILFFGFMAAHQIVYVPAHWSALAALPVSARQPLPLVGWMIDVMPISPTLYATVNAIAIVLCFMAIFGLWTRAAMLALIPIVFYVYGVPQFFGKLSHYHFFLWITVILAFSPCFDVWSIDAIGSRIRGLRADLRPHFRYGLAIRWIMLTLAGIYFFSGFRKLYEIGFYWSLSDNPVNLLRAEWLEQFAEVPWVRVDKWPILCKLAASGVILFELAYPFLLLGRRSRMFAALDAVLFHNLNGYFLKIDFVYLKTAHLSFLDWGRIVKWLRGKKRWMAWLIAIVMVGVFGGLVGVFFMFPVLLIAALVDLAWRHFPPIRRGRLLLQLRQMLPAARPQALHARRNLRWLRLSLATGAIMLTLNAACGAFGIHSWPFSSYPSYSFLRSGTMQYGWFLPVTSDGRTLDLDTTAQAANFRKENILPMAERIVDAWKYAPENLASAVENCWLRWRTELPALQEAIRAAVVIRDYSIDPDSFGAPPTETNIGEMVLIDGKWVFFAKMEVPNPNAVP